MTDATNYAAPPFPADRLTQHGVYWIQDTIEGETRWVLCMRPDTPAAVIASYQRLMQETGIPRIVTAETLATLQQNTQGCATTPIDHTPAPTHHLIEPNASPSAALDVADDAPVIQMIQRLLIQALAQRASDIHFQCGRDQLQVRTRVDGTLQTLTTLPDNWTASLFARIKMMAKLDIAEKRLPQDGRMHVTLEGRGVDVRVATLPSHYGERLVLRLLDQSHVPLHLANLGMPADLQRRFERWLQRPHGMILLTGPTGSGKTTTLYAALRLLNSGTSNILTIEDPIEYDLPGITQTATHDKIGFDFTKGLRAVLRQDPDVVMIGEIRDTETARIATQASLTGHLMLATLHTNTATGAIYRLMDMGVESFYVAHGLMAVINQRLMKKLCVHCKSPYRLDDTTAKRHNLPANLLLYRAVGCERCLDTGFHGRTAIYECLLVDDTTRRMILDHAPEKTVQQHGIPESLRLATAAYEQLMEGQITLSSYLAVTEPEHAV